MVACALLLRALLRISDQYACRCPQSKVLTIYAVLRRLRVLAALCVL